MTGIPQSAGGIRTRDISSTAPIASEMIQGQFQRSLAHALRKKRTLTHTLSSAH
jgi:hypothetical protein